MISISSWPDPQIGRSINHDTAECLAGANGEQGWVSVRSRCVRAWLREMETVIFGKFRSFPASPASDLSTRDETVQRVCFFLLRNLLLRIKLRFPLFIKLIISSAKRKELDLPSRNHFNLLLQLFHPAERKKAIKKVCFDARTVKFFTAAPWSFYEARYFELKSIIIIAFQFSHDLSLRPTLFVLR